MLVIALNHGAETTMTNSETGEVIKLCLARGGDSPRVGIQAAKKWNIVRSDANVKTPKRHPIQESNDGLNDLGRRVIDPLNVADAYVESEMFDHA
jgi:hypothetical protein